MKLCSKSSAEGVQRTEVAVTSSTGGVAQLRPFDVEVTEPMCDSAQEKNGFVAQARRDSAEYVMCGVSRRPELE